MVKKIKTYYKKNKVDKKIESVCLKLFTDLSKLLDNILFDKISQSKSFKIKKNRQLNNLSYLSFR